MLSCAGLMDNVMVSFLCLILVVEIAPCLGFNSIIICSASFEFKETYQQKKDGQNLIPLLSSPWNMQLKLGGNWLYPLLE